MQQRADVEEFNSTLSRIAMNRLGMKGLGSVLGNPTGVLGNSTVSKHREHRPGSRLWVLDARNG